MLSGRRESMRIINRGNNRNKGFVEQSKPVDLVLLKCSVHIVWEEVLVTSEGWCRQVSIEKILTGSGRGPWGKIKKDF